MEVLLLILSACIGVTLGGPIIRDRRQLIGYTTTGYAPAYTGYAPAYTGFGGGETDCQTRARITEPSWAKPVCNVDGSYREYQCDAYSRSNCWCVYGNGMMIPGSTLELHDVQQESSKLNCAAKRASAPKPPPNPPPIKAPFQDRRIGWHLAYRDAAMANNPYGMLYGSPYGYAMPQPAYIHAAVAPMAYSPPVAPVAYTSPAAMAPVAYPPPAAVAPMAAVIPPAAPGCPNPCPPPCTCMTGAYRGQLPKPVAPHKAVAVEKEDEDKIAEEPEQEDEEFSGADEENQKADEAEEKFSGEENDKEEKEDEKDETTDKDDDISEDKDVEDEEFKAEGSAAEKPEPQEQDTLESTEEKVKQEDSKKAEPKPIPVKKQDKTNKAQKTL